MAGRGKYYNSRGEFIGNSSQIVNTANGSNGMSGGETGDSSSGQASKKTKDSGAGAYIPSTAPYLP
jgi:hypothetical protein